MIYEPSQDITQKKKKSMFGNPLIRILHDHSKQIDWVALSPDDELLITGGDDGRVNLYSTQGPQSSRESNLKHLKLMDR